jgi:hypothetical protein
VSRRDDERVADILDAASEIGAVIELGRDAWDKDRIRQLAVERLLEIMGAGTERGKDAVQPRVARLPVRLGGGAGSTWLAAAAPALARAAVGEGPHRGPLPQRGGTASGSRAVRVGLGEVAEPAIGPHDVAVGVAHHTGSLGSVDQVVRVAPAVDPGERADGQLSR